MTAPEWNDLTEEQLYFFKLGWNASGEGWNADYPQMSIQKAYESAKELEEFYAEQD